MITWLLIAAYVVALGASLVACVRELDWEPYANAVCAVVAILVGLRVLMSAEHPGDWLAAAIWLGLTAPLAVRNYRHSRRRVEDRRWARHVEWLRQH